MILGRDGAVNETSRPSAEPRFFRKMAMDRRLLEAIHESPVAPRLRARGFGSLGAVVLVSSPARADGPAPAALPQLPPPYAPSGVEIAPAVPAGAPLGGVIIYPAPPSVAPMPDTSRAPLAELPEGPAPAPNQRRLWYGYQTLIVDGAALSMAIAGAAVQQRRIAADSPRRVRSARSRSAGRSSTSGHERPLVGLADLGMPRRAARSRASACRRAGLA